MTSSASLSSSTAGTEFIKMNKLKQTNCNYEKSSENSTINDRKLKMVNFDTANIVRLHDQQQQQQSNREDQHQEMQTPSVRKKKPRMSPFGRLFKLTLSSVLLILTVFIYSIMGALMFQLLEQHEELRMCQEGRGKYLNELKHLRETILNLGFNLTASTTSSASRLMPTSTSTTVDNYTDSNVAFVNEKITELLIDFRTQVLHIDEKYKYNGQNCELESKWTFFSSLLYAVTIMSTVGYGFLAPITWEGRIVSVCYATIGIPIFLLCLTNLSGSLANVFKFAYYKLDQVNPIKNYLEERKRLRRLKRRQQKQQQLRRRRHQSGGGRFSNQSSTTANSSSNNNNNNNILIVYQNQHHEHESFQSFHSENSDDEERNDEDDDDDDEDDGINKDADDLDEYEVPIYVAFIVILLYVAAAGYMFKECEDWTWTQSIYYVYVTASTMGFGDFVPGQKRNDQKADGKQLLVSLNCLFGMAILGMCFSIMKDEAINYIYLMKEYVKSLISCTIRQSEEAEEASAFEKLQIEKEKMISRIRMLKQYDELISVSRRKKSTVSKA